MSAEPNRGDVARAALGAVCAFIVMAILYEPTIKLAVPKALLFTAITVGCVITARNKAAVLFGVAAIVLFRLIVGVVLLGHRFS